MSKILLVEDEPKIRQMLRELLEGAGYTVSEITEYQSLEKIRTQIEVIRPDLTLMDLGLDRLNGLELLRSLREQTNLAVIILTGNTVESNELLAMGYGADDFILKPYKPDLLLLRIRAVLRRSSQGVQHDNYRLVGMEIDLARGVIIYGGRRVYLTKNEMIILRPLLEGRGKIVSRETLMTELWNNQEYINDNALTVNVSRLRNKLEKMAGTKIIETHKGLGYSLNEEK